MKYYLVTEDSNYADEFDLEAFALYVVESEEELRGKILLGVQNQIDENEERFAEADKYLAWPMEFYFGTNECITFESREEIFASLGVTEITKDQYDTIKDTLGGRFGVGAIL